ncbi:hypothetical protein TNCV_3727151, partial [Trichonephila clavipes]
MPHLHSESSVKAFPQDFDHIAEDMSANFVNNTLGNIRHFVVKPPLLADVLAG